ncbi:MAG: GNAT family N-acetyltransferase [Thermoplasmata archaeon]|jgi:ribosomal-protein-alanine N-acetyltransferase|nr:GNAT family N-acetyltransferase [Thermoplasmata archaeon]
MNRKTAFREFPEIRTKRLILRQPTMKDAEWYFGYFSRPEIVWGGGQPGPKDMKAAREEFREYLTDLYRTRRGFRWIITLKGEGKPIGTLGFYKWAPSASFQAEMGYDLMKEHWGKGIMTEAMNAVIDFGFEKMKLNRIEVYIMPRNKRSIRLVKRLGLKREGLLRQRYFDEFGNFADDILFSMLKSDWEEVRRPRRPKTG